MVRPFSAPVVSTSHGDGDMQHGHEPTTPGAIPLSTDRTYITSRKAFKMNQTTMEAEFGDFSMLRHSLVRARPKSAAVNTAAWKAYGSPSVRGQARSPRSPAAPTAPSQNTEFMPGRMPTVQRLGGGFRYPMRPWTANPAGPSSPSVRSSWAPGAGATQTPPAYTQGSPLSAPPTLERPAQINAAVYQEHKAVGGELRFSQTLPTDPNAKRVWSDLLSKAGGPATRRVQSARPSHGSPTRAHSGRHSSTSVGSGRERFASAYIYQTQHMQSAPIVPGFAAPESELVLPNPHDPRWTYTRLGRSALARLQGAMKMNRPGSPSHVERPLHSPTRMQAAPYAELLAHDPEGDVPGMLSSTDPALAPAAELASTRGELGVLDAVSEADEEEVDVSPLDVADAPPSPERNGQGAAASSGQDAGYDGASMALPAALISVEDEEQLGESQQQQPGVGELQHAGEQLRQQPEEADETASAAGAAAAHAEEGVVQEHEAAQPARTGSRGPSASGSGAAAARTFDIATAPYQALSTEQAEAIAGMLRSMRDAEPAPAEPAAAAPAAAAPAEEQVEQPSHSLTVEEPGPLQASVVARPDALAAGATEEVSASAEAGLPGTEPAESLVEWTHARSSAGDPGASMSSSAFAPDASVDASLTGLVEPSASVADQPDETVHLLQGAPAANQRYADLGASLEGGLESLEGAVLKKVGYNRPMSARPMSRGAAGPAAVSERMDTSLEVIEDDA
uniref:Uncharacterized protein n=1 Tax=Chlamydomonas leiostraca TaxID=1034604 RepID=A0A7S0RKY1_9CHLO|mmetsp:Transcript_25241/g.64147  ORF Transcript_25241/g.64147 Transcript_25241/m.64147 type:complete len:736 (+) Transcript_25241:146-2353(+)